MNTVTFLAVSGLAVIGLAGCDSPEAKQAAEDAKTAAAKAAESARTAAGKALEEAKETGSAALEKGRLLAGAASEKIRAVWDSARDRFGTPEVDGALEKVTSLFAEAEAAIREGASAETIAELKEKWNQWQAEVKDSMADLSAEKQEQLSGILSRLKEQWDSIVGGAGSAQSGN